MKMFTKILFAFVFLMSTTAFSQVVPNGGFEEWETNQQGGLQPVGWLAPMNSTVTQNVMQVPGNNGEYAAKLEVVEIQGIGAISATLISEPFAVNERYAKLKAYVKGNPVGGDSLYMVVGMYLGEDEVVGGGGAYIAEEVENFTEVTVNIFYDQPDVPDSCIITFVAGNPTGFGTEGTTFTVDDVSLSGIADVGELSPVFDRIGDVYPSPAFSDIAVPFTLKEPDAVSVQVFDMQGRLMISRDAASFGQGSHEIRVNVSGLETGMYMYRLIPSEGTPGSGTFMVK